MTYETNLALRKREWFDGQDELMHYGIRGQKWGVRRYQNEDGSLTQLGKEHYAVSTGGNSALARKYSGEAKKLEKYRNQQDVDLQRKKAESYGKKAATAGKVAKVSAAVAGTTLGLGSSAAVNKVNEKAHSLERIAEMKRGRHDEIFGDYFKYRGQRSIGYALDKAADEANRATARANRASNIRSGFQAARNINNVIGMVSSGVAAGAAATAAVYKIKQKDAQKRTTEIGHQKAKAKYEKQYNKMLKTFEGTPYEDILKKQKVS